MSQNDIEQAIARVKAGNLEDFRSVVVAFHPRLRAIVAGLCPPGVDSDEIAHCAFIEAYRRIDDYELGTNFAAWLTAIARNLLRAELEKIQRRGRNEQNYLDHILAQQLDRAVQEEPAALLEGTRFLGDCLGQLKADAQSVLHLRYREGWRVQQIARHFSRSDSAVSVQLFSLRQALRDCVRRKMALGQKGFPSDLEHGPA